MKKRLPGMCANHALSGEIWYRKSRMTEVKIIIVGVNKTKCGGQKIGMEKHKGGSNFGGGGCSDN